MVLPAWSVLLVKRFPAQSKLSVLKRSAPAAFLSPASRRKRTLPWALVRNATLIWPHPERRARCDDLLSRPGELRTTSSDPTRRWAALLPQSSTPSGSANTNRYSHIEWITNLGPRHHGVGPRLSIAAGPKFRLTSLVVRVARVTRLCHWQAQFGLWGRTNERASELPFSYMKRCARRPTPPMTTPSTPTPMI